MLLFLLLLLLLLSVLCLLASTSRTTRAMQPTVYSVLASEPDCLSCLSTTVTMAVCAHKTLTYTHTSHVVGSRDYVAYQTAESLTDIAWHLGQVASNVTELGTNKSS